MVAVCFQEWAEEIAAPLIPPFRPRQQGGGTVPVAGRKVFTAVVYVHTSGCAWLYLPPMFGTSPATAHRRFAAWTKAGLWRGPRPVRGVDCTAAGRPDRLGSGPARGGVRQPGLVALRGDSGLNARRPGPGRLCSFYDSHGRRPSPANSTVHQHSRSAQGAGAARD
ncbi:hypothetical protein SAV14893_005080 [Streptomyces avermitilis]|uniref:Insertion element IS402-like domain-containing protein n=1 Tax=Streptomyces avermitilis TaxID=33903 RepID=A0A4D4LJH8_STRAX|nr:hypothetical protein SAVMC3_17010 [Streptomyces avermitilis]GDY61115.1 hypothetical protein SAV14893_005080 [Streptomyces avermitilis]GDY78805.1 hypothetical protein SAV31267_082900 [Streptomyces avermitilis]GDY87627.1 hypothetical protein SAVCW2_68260 [Streptomyces avermitilis]